MSKSIFQWIDFIDNETVSFCLFYIFTHTSLHYLAGQMVDLVSVLSFGEAAAHEGDVLLVTLVIRLVLEDLHPLPASSLVLGGLGHGV